MVLPQHLLALDGFIRALLHHGLLKRTQNENHSWRPRDRIGNYCVSSGVEVGQELAVDEPLDVVDDKIHNGFWYEVPASLRHNPHVGVDQVANRLHLTLKLRIDGAERLVILL